MASATVVETLTKKNIGVFTNPKHDLWVAEATPSMEDVKSGKGLKPGEVTIEVRSTGICGYVHDLLLSLLSPQKCQLMRSFSIQFRCAFLARGLYWTHDCYRRPYSGS